MAILIDTLDEYLYMTWDVLCAAYDVTEPLPDIQLMFEGVSLAQPDRAAEQVLLNMLMEISESVGRFSPWYKMPARAFGLMTFRGGLDNRVKWILAPEAIQKWCDVLEPLALAIRDNTAVIEAGKLVNGFLEDMPSDKLSVKAHCQCIPQRSILISQSMAAGSQVLCSVCHSPFQPTQ